MSPELNCSNFEDRAVLYAAGELSEAERAVVDAHVHDCSGCAAILSSALELQKALASRVQPADALDRSDLLLAQCRSELFEALDDAAAQPKRAWYSAFLPSRWAAAFRNAFLFRPAWSAAAMLVLGLLAGTAGREWYRQISLPASGRPMVTISAPAPITQQDLEKIDLDGIRVEPQSDPADPKVELQLRSPRPRVMQGTPDDAEIRRVLAYVIGHSHQFDDGARLDSIDALRPKANDPQVRAAMSEALRHDPNPAVRLKAIEALRGAAPEPDVQSAILAALAGDDNSGVRIQALDTLFDQLESGDASSTPLDDQAVSILRDRMRNDSNSYIRSRSADALGRLASLDEDAPSTGGRHP